MYDYSDDAPTNQYPADKVPEAMGYTVFAVTDDGDTLCEPCVLDPTNPVHAHDSNRHASGGDGWGVIGWDHSGNVDTEPVTCCHCGKVIVEVEGYIKVDPATLDAAVEEAKANIDAAIASGEITE